MKRITLCWLAGLWVMASARAQEPLVLPPLRARIAEEAAPAKEVKVAPLATAPAVALAATEPSLSWGVQPRLSLRHDVGRGVGFDNGFSSIEGFVPVWRPTSDSLVFSDVRAVNFDHAERWEFNAGGGARTYSPVLNRVLGVNAFYDGRCTDERFFNQAGLGVEVLGKVFELRANGYFIVGEQRQLLLDTGVVTLGTLRNNILLARTQVFDVARSGVEVEAGAPLPLLERIYTRGYIGFYSYSASGTSTANGIRGRIESQLTERIALHLAVQHDPVFDTTFTGGLSISFGAPAFRRNRDRCLPTWTDVLGQRVQRDVNIVVSHETVTTPAFIPAQPPPPPPPPPPGEGQEGGG